MPFTAPSLATAQTDLATRLYDPLFVHWTAAELTVYIREALRTWNAWTAHWRDTGSFNLVMLQPFYDLPTVIPTLRAYTITNWELITDLQYALLEPPAAGGTWTGTEQFTLAQLSDAIQRRRDMFIQQTGSVLTSTITNYPATPASGRIDLDEAVLTVRRAAWRVTATQLLQPLMRTDEWAGTHFRPAWPQSTDAPLCYSTSVVPPITLQLIPPSGADGDLHLVSLNKGAVVNPLAAATLNVPDDWLWVVKYGALADLLQQDGLALDPARAKYCTDRWEQGVEAAKNASVVLTGRISGVTARISSLNDADRYTPLWQLLGGPPRELLIAGHNLIASSPPWGGANGPITIALDVVRNAPVPALPGDILQVGQDVYDAILDYSQHLALFKEGPSELETATALLERAAGVAGIDLSLQQAAQPSRKPLMQQTKQDERSTPREEPAVAAD